MALMLRGHLRKDDIAMMLRQLSAALHSGMTPYEALKMLQETSSSRRMRNIYRLLANECASGKGLSEAMLSSRLFIDDWLIGMVKVGELTGGLARMLSFTAEQYEFESAWQRKWRWSRLYLSVCILALVFVLPLPNALLEGFQWYLSLALKRILPALLSIWLLMCFLRSLSRVPKVSSLIRQLTSTIPIFGGAIVHRAIANFSLALAQALEAGMSAHQALEVSSEAIDVPMLKARAVAAVRAVQSGRSLSEALSTLFSPSERSSLHTGEKTGTISSTLMHIANERKKRMQSILWLSIVLQLAIAHIAIAVGIVFCVVSLYEAIFKWVEREFETQ